MVQNKSLQVKDINKMHKVKISKLDSDKFRVYCRKWMFFESIDWLGVFLIIFVFGSITSGIFYFIAQEIGYKYLIFGGFFADALSYLILTQTWKTHSIHKSFEDAISVKNQLLEGNIN